MTDRQQHMSYRCEAGKDGGCHAGIVGRLAPKRTAEHKNPASRQSHDSENQMTLHWCEERTVNGPHDSKSPRAILAIPTSVYPPHD